MAASRLKRAAGFGMAAALGLLAAVLCSGCSLQREYVRRGQVIDSMSVRLMRVEQGQLRHDQQMAKLRADILTELETIDGRLDQVDARFADIGDRLDRISRRVGAGRGDITPAKLESVPGTPPVPAKPDTSGSAPDTVGQGEDQLYKTAYFDFTRGKYEVAITEFRRYTASYPQSDDTDNAQYWIGECFYSLGRLDSAEVAFHQVMTSYPQGKRCRRPSTSSRSCIWLRAARRRRQANSAGS